MIDSEQPSSDNSVGDKEDNKKVPALEDDSNSDHQKFVQKMNNLLTP